MRRAVIGLVLLASCKPSIERTQAALASQSPAEREKAAEILRAAYAKDPLSFGDHGEAYWTARLKDVPGKAHLDFGKVHGGEGGGGGFSDNVELDDFWWTTVWGNQKDHVYTGYDPPRRMVRSVEAKPPAGFTGTWITYYIDGARHVVDDLVDGRSSRVREYHDNGQLEVDRTYVDGKLDGTFVWKYADGKTHHEESYVKGVQVGVSRWFSREGRLQTESYYRDGKIDGQSLTFDKDGKLQTCSIYEAGEHKGYCQK